MNQIKKIKCKHNSGRGYWNNLKGSICLKCGIEAKTNKIMDMTNNQTKEGWHDDKIKQVDFVFVCDQIGTIVKKCYDVEQKKSDVINVIDEARNKILLYFQKQIELRLKEAEQKGFQKALAEVEPQCAKCWNRGWIPVKPFQACDCERGKEFKKSVMKEAEQRVASEWTADLEKVFNMSDKDRDEYILYRARDIKHQYNI